MQIPTGLAFTASIILGCAAPAATVSGPTTTSAGDVSGPIARGRDAEMFPTFDRSPPTLRCRPTVADTDGCGAVDLETLLEPVRPRLERCHTGVGGKLRIRVRKGVAGKLAFDVQPDSSLDPTEMKCVLAALSTLDVDESATAWAGLSVRPTGFTSLITIEW